MYLVQFYSVKLWFDTSSVPWVEPEVVTVFEHDSSGLRRPILKILQLERKLLLMLENPALAFSLL